MFKLLTILSVALLFIIKTSGQKIDSLKLLDKEVPEGYKLTKNNNCISIQACIFYDKPELYESLIGKLKGKQIQSFDSKKDKGSILYFEFEDEFKGQDFLGALLWGGDKPTKEHPEEFFAKGNFLVIWSFKKGSVVTKTSRDKIITALK